MTAPSPQDEAALRAALAASPNSADAHAALADTLRRAARYAEAAAGFREALKLEPSRPDLQARLGHTLWAAGDALGAIAAYAQALAGRPNDAECAMNLAHALSALGDRDKALRWMRHALATNPADPVLQMNLGVIHFQRGEIAEAAGHYGRAVELRPNYAEAWLNYGNAALYAGDAAMAIERFDRALALGPHLEKALGNIVMGLSYVPHESPSEILRRAREWNARFALAGASPTIPAAGEQGHGDRPLRIGYVSPDLANHPIGHFMVGVFEHHDRERFPFTVYAERSVDDSLTQRLRARASGWRNTVGLSDRDLIAQIAADRIDILIDLAGHTSGNRLRVFSARPAPVQATWIGSIGTTGLPAIDYLIADRHHVPPGSEPNFVEKPLRLDQWICYVPPAYAPAVGPLPAARNGFITFGCFANPAKINAEVLAAWAAILSRVEGSRLLLKYRWLDSAANTRRIVSAFTAAGIAADRIRIEGETPHADLLARYGDVDIALDTFPYSGGATTLEALWMGVPVITRPEARFASRHSLSLLSTAGLSSLVASSTDDYIARVVRLASGTEVLAQMRASLRDRLAASPLCDTLGFTRMLEDGLRRIWQEYCVRPIEA